MRGSSFGGYFGDGGASVALIEVEGCIFDERLLTLSHGFESLDPVGREAFVNHLHLGGYGRVKEAQDVIESWVADMRSLWPSRTFRIYRQVEADEVTIRFHLVRPELPNWCEQGIEIICVSGAIRSAESNAIEDGDRDARF
jgi:hypothetical protein